LLHLHLYTLGMKEAHARTTTEPPTPVTPEKRGLSNGEWMQEETHLPWLRGLAAIPLTLLAQRTRTATANTGCVHHAQTSVSFWAMFMGLKRLTCWTTQRPISLERKVSPP
jgi:hypothetical protein